MKKIEFLKFKNFYKNCPFLIFLVKFLIDEKNQKFSFLEFLEIFPNWKILSKVLHKDFFFKKNDFSEENILCDFNVTITQLNLSIFTKNKNSGFFENKLFDNKKKDCVVLKKKNKENKKIVGKFFEKQKQIFSDKKSEENGFGFKIFEKKLIQKIKTKNFSAKKTIGENEIEILDKIQQENKKENKFKIFEKKLFQKIKTKNYSDKKKITNISKNSSDINISQQDTLKNDSDFKYEKKKFPLKKIF